MDWISLEEQLPEHFDGYRKFWCKTVTGSIDVEEKEQILLGKWTPTGFRFTVMDWQYVTHWKYYDKE